MNLEYIIDVVKCIVWYVKWDIIVVMKSIVFVGINDLIDGLIIEYFVEFVSILVVFNLEFLCEGLVIYDMFYGDRIVIGMVD